MNESQVRSFVKAFRDLGVQVGPFLLTVWVAIQADPQAAAALRSALPSWVVGLFPVAFVITRVIQDQAKHGGKQPE